MKIQKLNKLLIIALILSATIVTAQKSDPNFVYDLGGSIEKMTVTDSGVLLITHGKGLAGIKPDQKELVFNLLGETLISMKTNA